MRYRVFVHLTEPDRPPTIWKGASVYDGNGMVIDMPDLPADVRRAVTSAMRQDGGRWGGTQLQQGRYCTYRAVLDKEAA